jgi:hypothetical protein
MDVDEFCTSMKLSTDVVDEVVSSNENGFSFIEVDVFIEVTISGK